MALGQRGDPDDTADCARLIVRIKSIRCIHAPLILPLNIDIAVFGRLANLSSVWHNSMIVGTQLVTIYLLGGISPNCLGNRSGVACSNTLEYN